MATLTILPTGMSARDVVIRRARDGAVFGHTALSHNQFVRSVVEAGKPGRAWLSGGEGLALVAKVVDEFYERFPDAPFAGLRRRAGFWRSLQSFLAECRMGCLEPSELSPVLAAGGVPAARANLLQKLYESHAERLRAMGAVDAATAECEMANILDSAATRVGPLLDIDAIEIRGVYDVKPATFEWILALAKHIPTTVIFPVPDHHPRNVKWLQWAFGKFEYLADEEPAGLSVQSEDLVTSRAIAGLLPRLYEPVAMMKQNRVIPLDAATPLRLLEAGDPRTEVHEIARMVRGRIDAGDAPERIAIIFRKPDLYPNALDAFESFGVPVEISSRLRTTWLPDEVGREVLDFAHLAAEGFERESLIGWLGRTRCDIPEPLRHPDLAKFMREAGFLHGTPDALRERLKQYAARQKDHVRPVIDRIATAIGEVLSDAGRLSQPSTPSVFLRALRECLETIGLFRAPFSDQSVALAVEFHRLTEIVGDWRAKLEPHVLLELVEDLSADRAAATGGVRLLSIHDLPAVEIDHLFVAGMLSGVFPAEPKQEVFLKDRERQAVVESYAKTFKDRWGARLAGHRVFDTAPEERLRENFYFFLCLAQPTRSVTLSFPKRDSEGRPSTPSPYLDEISKHFKDMDAIRATAAVAARTPLERDCDAVAALETGGAEMDVCDQKRLRRIVARIDVERRRERFFIERDRVSRERLAFDYTGRLARPGPYWVKSDMAARSLESFAGCPFRGFARESLHLREIERPEEGLTPRDIGSLLHKFLELLWKEILRRHPGRPANPGDVLKSARAIAPGAFEEACRQLLSLNPDNPLRASQRSALRYLIESIVESVEADTADGYWPVAIEESFEAQAPQMPDLGVRHLTGRFDRVDRTTDGNIRIVDYKLSSATILSARRDNLWTTDVQLAVYAFAAAERWKLKPEQTLSLSYVSLKYLATLMEMWSGPSQEFRALFDPARVLEVVAEGRFDVTPVDPRLCKTCEFRHACRVLPGLTEEEEE